MPPFAPRPFSLTPYAIARRERRHARLYAAYDAGYYWRKGKTCYEVFFGESEESFAAVSSQYQAEQVCLEHHARDLAEPVAERPEPVAERPEPVAERPEPVAEPVADSETRKDSPMPPFAPRPFSQLARRNYRLGLDIPRGYMPFADPAIYRQKRRRAWKQPFVSYRSFAHPVPCELCSSTRPKGLHASVCMDCAKFLQSTYPALYRLAMEPANHEQRYMQMRGAA